MNLSAPWLPRSVEALRTYNRKTFLSDLIAGITVGLVALPLAMAFAISSGLTPEQGIYCAVVTGFLISALGGSRCQIGGPTGAFVVVVYGIVEKYGVGGLYVVTFMAGVLILLLGLTGMGTAVRFIPRPVIVGFTNGIALLIASTQIKDFFGIQLAKVPGEFFERMEALLGAAHTASPAAMTLGAAALATIIFVMKFVPRIPGYIVALIGGTAATVLLSLPVETIGSRFGGIPAGLPKFHLISLSITQIVQLMQPAVTVALLGAIESLMSAVVADRMSNDQHNPNTELVAQGIANMVSPMFGGLPATGAIARTATNIRSGAKTPMAGIIHALTLLAVILAAAPLAKFVPLPVLAAILFVVAYNMGEWGEIPEILKLSRTEIAVWFVTFALTVVADLTLAVQVGMISAALLYIRKVTQTTTVTEVTRNYVDDGWVHILQGKEIPPYMRVFRIHGPFLFGSTDKLKVISDQIDQLPEIVALRLRNMTAIDGTGLKALEDLADALHESGRVLLLCGAREQPARMLNQSELTEHVGRENVLPHIKAAVERAVEIHSERAGRASRRA
ncbi:MAG TPA: SulP family inorganic anion transporter [Bryobacteraceae bacterium]|nr:SulP family inorganic anion transporter [Bryobacteraceae bacterium]